MKIKIKDNDFTNVIKKNRQKNYHKRIAKKISKFPTSIPLKTNKKRIKSNKNAISNNNTFNYINDEIENSLSLISSNNSKNSSKSDVNSSFSSLDLYAPNNKFEFLLENKKNWQIYFDFFDEKNEKKWYNLSELASQFLKTKKTEIDILIELVLTLDKIRRNSNFTNKSLPNENYDKPIAKIWNLSDFDGNYSDAWKKYNIGPQYKKRYTQKFKKSIAKNWENILYFIGFSFILRNENIWDYLWYLFYLPKRLLILWLARLNIIDKNDYWWLLLLKEWKSFYYEILRSKNIKNWLDIFSDMENESKIKRTFLLKLDDNFEGM